MIVLVAVVAICAFLDRATVVFESFEQKADGLRLRVYSSQHDLAELARQQIVLVTISDDTFEAKNFKNLKAESEAPPRIPRDYHAKVVREMARAGAKVIAFDLLFDTSYRHEDEQLAVAVAEARKKSCHVVWGCLWNDRRQQLDLPNAALRQASPYWGHTRAAPNLVDTFDRVEVVIKGTINTSRGSKPRLVPAFCLQAARLKLGLKKPRFMPDCSGNLCQVGTLNIPVNTEAASGMQPTFKITYLGLPDPIPGPPHPIFQEVAYEDIYNLAPNDAKALKQQVNGKVVLIGDIRQDEDTQEQKDVHPTPVGMMSGLEINAYATATLLLENFIYQVSPWANILVLCVLAALSSLLAIVCRVRYVTFFIILLLIAYFVFNIWLFVNYLIELPLVTPSVAAMLTMLGVLTERGWAAERETKRVRDILDHVLGPEAIKEGVPTGTMTLVFTDIEGHAEVVEHHGTAFEPLRSEHFRLLREAAKRWNGFEVETAGDSLFAVFAKAADAVQFAVQAQLAMMQHPWPPAIGTLRIRIGMNTGEPFVGQDRRRLTFHGRVTNRAARVMAAGHGGQILVSEATYEAARSEIPEPITFLDHGIHRLKSVGEEHLFQVRHPELPLDFPSLNTLSHIEQDLSHQTAFNG